MTVRLGCSWTLLAMLLMAVRGTVCAAADRPPSPSLPTRQTSVPAEPRGDVLIVLGAEGTPEFGVMFAEWSGLWESAAQRGGWRFHLVGDLVGDAASTTARTKLHDALDQAAAETEEPLWIVFLGHGTFDGRDSKFNLVGEDVTADELAAWLQPIRRPTAILQCASTSGAFLDVLSGEQRVVVTATKSGQELNFARFGGFLAAAFVDPAADVDKDEQISLLEAFLRAARLTEEFYTGDNRLATEHALIDDNGDRRGTRAAAFAGVRPVREADSGATLDGYLAHQWLLVPSPELQPLPPALEQRRQELETAVLQLRERKGELPEDEYYAALERLLIELARLSLGPHK